MIKGQKYNIQKYCNLLKNLTFALFLKFSSNDAGENARDILDSMEQITNHSVSVCILVCEQLFALFIPTARQFGLF